MQSFITTVALILLCVFASIFFPDSLFQTVVDENLSLIQALGSGAIAISAAIAFALYRTTVDKNKKEEKERLSKLYQKEAIKTLKRSYGIFTGQAELGVHVKASYDRLTWLTTARMILSYQKLRNGVTEDSHKETLEQVEEYWRTLYYQILDFNKPNFDRADFFEHKTVGPINVHSIAVIFDFASWKMEKDSIDEVNLDTSFAKQAIIPIDQFGLRKYLYKKSTVWKTLEDEKK